MKRSSSHNHNKLTPASNLPRHVLMSDSVGSLSSSSLRDLRLESRRSKDQSMAPHYTTELEIMQKQLDSDLIEETILKSEISKIAPEIEQQQALIMALQDGGEGTPRRSGRRSDTRASTELNLESPQAGAALFIASPGVGKDDSSDED